MLPVGFSRSSYDFIDSNPYILDQNSGVPVTCVFHAWFDAYDLIGGAKGRNTVISVGLWAWQMESSRAVSQLPCGSHVPEHHPWAQRGKRGWWLCYRILRSRALLRSSCRHQETPFQFWFCSKSLCGLGQVIWPLWASVSPLIKWPLTLLPLQGSPDCRLHS